ncbi:orotidine-5'-phosphate decarboxylase [Parvimonas micra]|uniref:Orotidine 5'-phosphate decarboxylase n=1 Tax=Parvimonas micra TaxID=33033 RepID=A0A9X3K7N9_9FIRM|nr:orotidine-5'-phosphate decarboxylase [Parvimonas micra]MCZ7408226.1 orotidine-5'-phosphate decarboxylase [Parvimonas micra]MCZ7409068.1 orotidine-5'-phosphate decarboxylase [Parvimonas micra]MCZ7410153.1 orotidine-5'-phosphate decarboxylase [Parvimonas micra]MCZ7411982.1 orotidine-5'-phosphate decarboxylase [Parvimonas micra]WBB37061.1 orotidine-5'-phosphate decarboxylase [Parvimonas micra]
MIVDRLYEAVKEKGFVCVGLDSHLDYIPNYIKQKHEKISDIIFEYNKTIIDATSDIVAIYKPQIAYYEANGLEGLIAYQRTLRYLKEKGLLSIGDVKRGDIASTAKEYAKAHFKGEFEADFITLNPYMGMDSITPYLDYLKTGEKGVFVLLRTSNEGAKDIECLDYNGEALYFKVGDELKKFADELTSECGYSPLGFVVGATHSEEAKKIRERYKNIFFLLPGYGAQGAKAEDIRTYLNDFNGGVVNSSRGIIKYYQKFEDGEERFAHYTREAVLNMRKDIYGE